jgi:O-antigen/teichoic acid export membrane protein
MTGDPALPVEGLSRASVRGTAWLTVQGWTVNGTSLIVFVILGRLLEPKDFGLVAAATVIVLFLRLVVDAGISGKIVQRPSLEPELIDTAFWVALGAGTVLAGLSIALAPLTADLFGQPRLAPVIRVLSLMLAIAALDRTQSALLDRAMAFRSQAIRAMVAAVISSVAAIALAVAGAGVWSLVAQNLVFEGVSVVLLWRLTTWRPHLRFDRRYLGELLGFGGQLSGIRVLAYLAANIDNFLIGIVLGPVALGIYVAYRILIVINEMLALTFGRISLPAFSRLASDRTALNQAFYRIAGISALLVLPICAGLASVAPHLVPAVFGSKWDRSIRVMEILAAAGVVQAATTFTQSFAIAVGRVNNELQWNLVLTTAQVTGFAIAVHFGIDAVAISLAVVSVVFWPLRLLFLSRLSGLSVLEYYRRWIRPAVCTAIMSGVVVVVGNLFPAHTPDVAVLAVQVAAGCLSYPLALRLIDRPLAAEFWELTRMLRPARERSSP